MNTKSRPCTDRADYDFYRCVETFFYNQHGCQYPWNVFKGSDIPVCSNLSRIKEMIYTWDRSKGLHRDDYSNLQRVEYTKNECLTPCNETRFRLTYIDNREEIENEMSNFWGEESANMGR